MQFVSLSHAKVKFKRCIGVLEADNFFDLSCNGRSRDSFVTIDTMTPGDFKSGGVGRVIDYYYAVTPFGQVLLASTSVGLCHLAFEPFSDTALAALHKKFPDARYRHAKTALQ